MAFLKVGTVESLQKNVFLDAVKVKIELPILRVSQKFPPAAGYIINLEIYSAIQIELPMLRVWKSVNQVSDPKRPTLRV